MLTLTGMMTEYKHAPLGMDEPCPRFFYRLEGADVMQKAYRITARKADGEQVWDSGIVESSDTVQIPWGGKALEPFTRYFWQVESHLDSGIKVTSSEAFFETGFCGTPWQAKWIGTYEGSAFMRPVQLLKRRFTLDNAPSPDARIAITALGLYQAEINGVKVGNDLLTPGWTDYYSRVQYQVYDISQLLHPGENEITIQLGEGWYCGRIARYWNLDRPTWGEHPMVLAELRQNGTVFLATDETWKSYTSCRRYSDIYDGEKYDGTRYSPTGAGSTFEEAGAPVKVFPNPSVTVEWQTGAPVRELAALKPVSVTRRPNGIIAVDFGKNFSGRERIKLYNPGRGAVITIRHGEMLNPDGTLYTANLRTAESTTIYISEGREEEIYEPLFTFYGFRYIEISNWPGEFTEESIEGVLISSDLPVTGTFSCSNHLVNTLFTNVLNGQRSNFVDVPTDCPQRDEKQGWTGDAQVFANTATYNLFSAEFYTKWIRDLQCSRVENIYPNYVPFPNRPQSGWQMLYSPAILMRHIFSTGWGDAGITVPLQMLRKYSDVRLVKNCLPNMVKFLDTIISANGGNPIVSCSRYGDWLNLDDPTPPELLATAYLAGMNRLCAQMAELVGEKEIAADRMEKYEWLKEAFIKEFYTEDLRFKGESQTSKLLALHFDLTPDNRDLWALVVESLLHDIEKKRKMHLSTGFLGTPLLLPVLTKVEALDTAYSLLLQSSYPSWLYPVIQGATTMWERWNSWNHETGFGDVCMNSFNHYAYGAVAEWFYEDICGIKPDPTFKRFKLEPRFGRFLDHAEAVYESIYGTIKSAWRRNGEDYIYEFVIPPNTEALVRGTLYGPGTYKIDIKHYTC